MDGRRLDAFAVKLAADASRRRLLGSTTAGAGAMVLAWLGVRRSHTAAVGQELPTVEIDFPVQPICTCPSGLVLCRGLCVPSAECSDQSGQAEAAPTGTAVVEPPCPPQEQFCPTSGVCVPCPVAMILDSTCRCICPPDYISTCSASCECPKVAACACVCPGPPCDPPKVQNADTCQCVCANRCLRPFVPDPVTCECVCPPGTTPCGRRCIPCPPGATVNGTTCACVCETIEVPTDGTTVTSLTTLTAATPYTIRASGLFNIGGKQADAEYLVGPTNNQIGDKCGPGGSFADIGLAIDDPNLGATTKTPASWGPYRTDHIYTTTYTGTGNPIALNYHECPGFHYDNIGTLTVQILCPTTPPDRPTPVGEVPVGATAQVAATNTPTPTATPRPTPTNTPVPALTATAAPTPTPVGPPTCDPDELLCVNVCIPATDCPAASCCFVSETCTCTCADCAGNFVFDPATCACRCQPPPCLPNWQVLEETCSCVCPVTPCPPGQLFDPEGCGCVDTEPDPVNTA